MTVLERFLAGDTRALSRLISVVEDRSNDYLALLARLYDRAGRSIRIGFTGPPGAGKSTLVNVLARRFLDSGRKVGIIAVDPSSPFSGGALLGDRVRMADFPGDGSFFFRSMATRGATGGLASATDNVTLLYDAFGFDYTLIETVGVGQVELDIVDSCDSVVVILVPESGDAVQTMKAGLMEIADLFCVNKADRSGAQRIASDLGLALATRKDHGRGWEQPVIQTEAIHNKNVDRLFDALDQHLQYTRSTGLFEEHRRTQLRKKVLSIIKNRFQRELIERIEKKADFDSILDDILEGKTNPFEASRLLYERFARN